MSHNVTFAVFAILTLFNFIFIVFLVCSPRELRDVNNNLDYFKVFGASVLMLSLVVFVYFVLVMLTQVYKRK